MSRYTGPRARVSRRLGTNIFGTKGEVVALDKRPYPPGEHGRTRRRGNPSEYLVQLQEKQKARFAYGLSEKQFRRIYAEANRRQGVTGENMLQYLELRLDNVVYRAGMAATRPQARQLVNHGHVDVNGSRVDIPSYRCRKGDVVTLRDKARKMVVVQWNIDVLDRQAPAWLDMGENGYEVTVRELPLREHRRSGSRTAHCRALFQVVPGSSGPGTVTYPRKYEGEKDTPCWSFSDRPSKPSAKPSATVSSFPSARLSRASATPWATRSGGRCCRLSRALRSLR